MLNYLNESFQVKLKQICPRAFTLAWQEVRLDLKEGKVQRILPFLEGSQFLKPIAITKTVTLTASETDLRAPVFAGANLQSILLQDLNIRR